MYYHIKRTESPVTSLLALTNTLHPVVSKCLFGWPENVERYIKSTQPEARIHSRLKEL